MTTTSLIIEDLEAKETEDIDFTFHEAIRDDFLLLVIELRFTGDCMGFRLNYAQKIPTFSASYQSIDGQSFSINPKIASSEWMPVEEEDNM